MKDTRSIFKKWWEGKVSTIESEPDSFGYKFPMSYIDRPIIAKIISKLFDFWCENWKTLFGFLLAIASMLLTFIF